MKLDYKLLKGDPGWRKPRVKKVKPIKVRKPKKKPNKLMAWLNDKIEW